MSNHEEKPPAGEPRVPDPPGECRPAADADTLTRELEGARADADRYKDLYLRARADLENQQKRVIREIETRTGHAKDALVRALLPVKDGLEAGLARAATVADPAVAPFREGMEVAVRQWDAAFAAAGIESIDPLGQPFDPQRHEALAVRPVAGPELSHTVVEVSQKGYTLDGRLIRPALVVVAQ